MGRYLVRHPAVGSRVAVRASDFRSLRRGVCFRRLEAQAYGAFWEFYMGK